MLSGFRCQALNNKSKECLYVTSYTSLHVKYLKFIERLILKRTLFQNIGYFLNYRFWNKVIIRSVIIQLFTKQIYSHSVLNYGDYKHFSNMTCIHYYSSEDYVFSKTNHILLIKQSFKVKTVLKFKKKKKKKKKYSQGGTTVQHIYKCTWLSVLS